MLRFGFGVQGDGCHLDQPIDDDRGEARGKSKNSEEEGRAHEQHRRCVGGLGVDVAVAAGFEFGVGKHTEQAEHKPGRIGERQDRCNDNDDEDHRGANEVAVLDVAVEPLLLRDKSEQRWEPSHRGCADDSGDERRPPALAKARDATNVAGPDLVVDNTNDHEQRRLERSVGQQEHHTSLRDVVVAGAEQQHHETQLAHRAVGEQ